jgi:hypothetical protein
MKPMYEVTVSVDKDTGRLLATYLRVCSGDVLKTRELLEGKVFADYGEDGALLGVEMLSPCREEELQRLFADQPETVRRFIPAVAPRQLVPA